MITLIYHSLTTCLNSNNDICLFMQPIRLRNIKFDVTGVLLHHEGKIMQILEGEEEIISNLFEKIKVDKRHTNIVKLIDFKMEKRSYGDWAMVAKRVSQKDWLNIEGYLNMDNQKVCPQHASKSNYLQMLINSFIEENVNNQA